MIALQHVFIKITEPGIHTENLKYLGFSNVSEAVFSNILYTGVYQYLRINVSDTKPVLF